MSRERQQKLESPKKVEEKFENSESSKHIKVQIEPQQFVEISTKPKTFSNKMKLDEKSSNFDQKGSTKKVESPNVSVRHVPIRLDDGKIIQRDPDETMEIRLGQTVFQNKTFGFSIVIDLSQLEIQTVAKQYIGNDI